MTGRDEETAMLYRLARQDALAFATLVANPDIDLRIACFHGQQAVEKFFKAALVAQRLSFEPTHNLLKLSNLFEGGDCSAGDYGIVKAHEPLCGGYSLR
jgi:HEPN domain-containing protein